MKMIKESKGEKESFGWTPFSRKGHTDWFTTHTKFSISLSTKSCSYFRSSSSAPIFVIFWKRVQVHEYKEAKAVYFTCLTFSHLIPPSFATCMQILFWAYSRSGRRKQIFFSTLQRDSSGVILILQSIDALTGTPQHIIQTPFDTLMTGWGMRGWAVRRHAFWSRQPPFYQSYTTRSTILIPRLWNVAGLSPSRNNPRLVSIISI